MLPRATLTSSKTCSASSVSVRGRRCRGEREGIFLVPFDLHDELAVSWPGSGSGSWIRGPGVLPSPLRSSERALLPADLGEAHGVAPSGIASADSRLRSQPLLEDEGRLRAKEEALAGVEPSFSVARWPSGEGTGSSPRCRRRACCGPDRARRGAWFEGGHPFVQRPQVCPGRLSRRLSQQAGGFAEDLGASGNGDGFWAWIWSQARAFEPSCMK